MKINDCYWLCGGHTRIMFGSATRVYAACDKCDASGPVCDTKDLAIEAWNLLASRLKPAPKVVTLKQWANVYGSGDSYSTSGLFDCRQNAVAFSDKRNRIDTVEVEITFTDSRGVND